MTDGLTHTQLNSLDIVRWKILQKETVLRTTVSG